MSSRALTPHDLSSGRNFSRHGIDPPPPVACEYIYVNIYIYVVIYLDSLFSRSFFLSCYFLHPFHWRFLPRYGEKVAYLGRESRSSARCRGLTTCCSGNFFFFVFFLFLPFPLPSEASEGNCCERGASCVHSEPRPDDYPN